MTENNHRVGYGGGFYDRYLEKHPTDWREWPVAFEFQMMPEVPTEPTDICPHIVMTEESVIHLTLTGNPVNTMYATYTVVSRYENTDCTRT